jgi:hypothetical protein
MKKPGQRALPLPDPAALGERGAQLVRRWEALLAGHPSLGPWLERTLSSLRKRLRQDQGELLLWAELERALLQLERLSPLDLGVVASSVEDSLEEERGAAGAKLGTRADAGERLLRVADERALSPEDALDCRQVFERHPGMALAGYCTDEALLPRLHAIARDRAQSGLAVLAGFAVPDAVWAGELRDDCLREGAELSCRVAIGVLLNLSLAGSAPQPLRELAVLLKAKPGAPRTAREASTLRAAVQRLPAEWGLRAGSPEELAATAASLSSASAQARRALEEAVALFDRLACSLARRAGWPEKLFDAPHRGEAASDAELAALIAASRKKGARAFEGLSRGGHPLTRFFT